MYLALVFLTTFTALAEPAPELDFSQAYSQILDRSIRIETQKWNVENAVAKTIGKRGILYPKFGLSYSRTDQNYETGPLYITPSVDAAVTTNLSHSGADMAGLDGAREDEHKEASLLQNERLGAEEDAVEALILAIQRSKEREIIEALVDLKDQALQLAKKRYQKSLLPVLELEKSGIEVANAKARLNDAVTALSAARAQLATLLGHANVKNEWPWKEKLSAQSAIQTDKFKIESRPDYMASKLSVNAENFRLKQYQRQMYPSLDFSFDYGIGGFNNAANRYYQTSIVFTIPIFNQLQDYSSYRQQITTVKQAELNVETLIREVPPLIESLQREFRVALESAKDRDHTLETSQRISDDSLERFRLGRISVNDLAIDQNRLLESNILDTRGWGAAHIAFSRLCHAMGESLAADGSCGDFSSAPSAH